MWQNSGQKIFPSNKKKIGKQILIKCGEAPGEKYFRPVKIQVVRNLSLDVVKLQGKIFSSHKKKIDEKKLIRCGEAPGKRYFHPVKIQVERNLSLDVVKLQGKNIFVP